MNIKPYLKLMIDRKASDIFVTADSPVKIKIEGKIMDLTKQDLTEEMAKDTVYGLLNEEQAKIFQEELEIDFAIEFEHQGRFRVNAFYQRGKPAMVLRYIPSRVPSMDSLSLPDALKDIIMHKRGIVLMVGATGSGKSTTLAAMVDYRNSQVANHIITVEDPIEYVHLNKKSVVNQREIGTDTHSYSKALKSAMREAPDVIQIGEIRTRETMETTMELSGTGHLAISTLHANNAYQALKRIVNMFPEEMHTQLFMDLALNMRAVISQRLVPGVDGKRVAALEILVNTPYVSELILDGRISEIPEAMGSTREGGMQTFDQSLLDLYRQQRIAVEDALAYADSRANLEAKLYFG